MSRYQTSNVQMQKIACFAPEHCLLYREISVLTDNVFREHRWHQNPLPGFMVPAVQLITVQIFRNEILQVHKPAFFHLEFQRIVFVVEHRQMNILFNAFFIAIVRQLHVSAITGDNGILARNKGEIYDASVVTQYLERVAGFQRAGHSRNFRYIVAQLPDTFQVSRFETCLFLRHRSCYSQQHRRQQGNKILLFHVRIYLVNVLASSCHKYKCLFRYYNSLSVKKEPAQQRLCGLLHLFVFRVKTLHYAVYAGKV